MIYSALLYLGLMCVMIFINEVSFQTHFATIGTRKRTNISYFAIFLFALIFGIRYDVGIDHLRYLESYELLKIPGIVNSDNDTELGFLFIGKLFAGLDLHYAFYFFVLAFLQLFLVFYAFRRNYKLVSWIILTFFLSTTFLNFMNGIRQEIAFCFELVALFYLSERKYLKCYLNIIFAILFHLSAVILLPLPLLFIKRENYFNKVSLQLILYFLCLFVGYFIRPSELLFNSLMNTGLLELFGYEGYKYMVLGGDTNFIHARREAGLGFLLILIVNIINISLSKKIKEYYNSTFLNILYDFYYFGILYRFITMGSLIFDRLNYYFYNIGFIISAFVLNYLFRNKSNKNTILFFSMLLIYILLFGAVIILRGEESCAIYKMCF